LRNILLRGPPKDLITTSYWKLYEGTRLTAVPNSKKLDIVHEDEYF